MSTAVRLETHFLAVSVCLCVFLWVGVVWVCVGGLLAHRVELPLAFATVRATDAVVSASELGAFKELVPDSNWSHEDFVKRFGHHVPAESHRSVFDELDEDGDGLLNQKEKMGINAKILGGSDGLHKTEL